MARYKPIPCYKCRHYRETECLQYLGGFPDIGELCEQWDAEAGTDEMEGEDD